MRIMTHLKQLNKSSGYIFILILFFFFSCFMINAEENKNQGFIYGKINLKDGSELEGPMRWGTEEAFWHDFFNSVKEENEFHSFLSEEDIKLLKKKKGRRGFKEFIRNLFGSDSDRYDILPTHQFVCRFGDIKKLEMIGRETVRIIFRDDEDMIVEGGSNDIGAQISIIDKDHGQEDIFWKKISSVEFMPTPHSLEETFGSPLYGTVYTKTKKFSGFIQWDHQECVDNDELDGEYEDGEISLKFKKIKSIEKFKRGSLVTLISGKEYYIYGTNDVNRDNRGIIINQFDIGKILVEWDEFDRVVFKKNPDQFPASFEDFSSPQPLMARVKTKRGKSFSGRMAFDLDEKMNFEIISGYQDDIKWNIPLRNITFLRTMGSCCTKITLKNGNSVILEEERDVNGMNDGLLVWDDSEEPTYIEWKDVREIKLH